MYFYFYIIVIYLYRKNNGFSKCTFIEISKILKKNIDYRYFFKLQKQNKVAKFI